MFYRSYKWDKSYTKEKYRFLITRKIFYKTKKINFKKTYKMLN